MQRSLNPGPTGGALTPSNEGHGVWEGGSVEGCRANSGGPAARGACRDRERDKGFPRQPNPDSPSRAVRAPPLRGSGPTFSAAPLTDYASGGMWISQINGAVRTD